MWVICGSRPRERAGPRRRPHPWRLLACRLYEATYERAGQGLGQKGMGGVEHRVPASRIPRRRRRLAHTLDDVAAAIDHIAVIDGAVDPTRVVTCGHSAGGQLALWAAARGRLPAGSPGDDVGVTVRGAVSLAGVVDLKEADRLGLGRMRPHASWAAIGSSRKNVT